MYIYRYIKPLYTIPNLTKNLLARADEICAYKVQIIKFVYSNGQILKFVPYNVLIGQEESTNFKICPFE